MDTAGHATIAANRLMEHGSITTTDQMHVCSTCAAPTARSLAAEFKVHMRSVPHDARCHPKALQKPGASHYVRFVPGRRWVCLCSVSATSPPQSTSCNLHADGDTTMSHVHKAAAQDDLEAVRPSAEVRCHWKGVVVGHAVRTPAASHSTQKPSC
jgi:hypothetical protein